MRMLYPGWLSSTAASKLLGHTCGIADRPLDKGQVPKLAGERLIGNTLPKGKGYSGCCFIASNSFRTSILSAASLSRFVSPQTVEIL